MTSSRSKNSMPIKTLFPTSALSSSENIDVSEVKGNISDDDKRFCSAIFAYFVSSPDKSYGATVGKRLKFVEVNIWNKNETDAYGETFFEIKVEKDMCNIFGTLHGGCAAYIIDPCSVSSCVALGKFLNMDGSGVSQSVNIIWHQPILCGATVRVKSTSVIINGRSRSARCEIWDGQKLCISATHCTINPLATSLRKQPTTKL